MIRCGLIGIKRSNKTVELLIDVACVVFIASPPGTAGKAWTQSREGGDQDLVRQSETEDEEAPTGDTECASDLGADLGSESEKKDEEKEEVVNCPNRSNPYHK